MTDMIRWPDGKRFAFTIFDDTDCATLDNVGGVYSLLQDLGFQTTRSCWPLRGDPAKGKHQGQTAEDPDYLQWLLDLQSHGFEIAWHGATWHGVPRSTTSAALDRFAELFGDYPTTAANHTGLGEGMYWADHRLTGLHVPLYNLLTRRSNQGKYRGHIEGEDCFWGDLCKEKIQYYRNFVFRDINTLKACPFMPYHDPLRPYVNYWFASSDGHNVESFVRCVSERNQDRLEAEGGACIMYTHFAFGFSQDRTPDRQFTALMKRMAAKNGWFVPVRTLLDHLQTVRGHHDITPAERSRLERKWLWEKLWIGSN